MRSLQKMQTFFFCFFCQPLSSFSFLAGRRREVLGGIERRLLARRGGADGGRRGPLAAARAPLTLDLGGRPPQARTDLVGLDLHHGALLALLRLPLPHLEAAGHDDARAPRKGLGDVLREGAPRVDREVGGLPVLPVAGLVLVAAVDRHPELHDGGAVRRVPKLGVVRQVANDDDLVLARHLSTFRSIRSPGGMACPVRGKLLPDYAASPRTTTLNRSTSSASCSVRSTVPITPGS